MRLVVISVVLCAVLVGALAVHRGAVPPPGDVIRELANRPEVGDKFQDPQADRFDATVFLFTVLVMAPLVGLGALAVFAVSLLIVEATIMPLGRRIGLPDGLVHAFVVLGVAVVAYAQSNLWLPRSLKLLGLLARAYLITST